MLTILRRSSKIEIEQPTSIMSEFCGRSVLFCYVTIVNELYILNVIGSL